MNTNDTGYHKARAQSLSLSRARYCTSTRFSQIYKLRSTTEQMPALVSFSQSHFLKMPADAIVEVLSRDTFFTGEISVRILYTSISAQFFELYLQRIADKILSK
jgi:hypothetical protein